MQAVTFSRAHLSSDKKRLVFNVNDVDVAYVNALRRVIIAEIPTVAIAYDPYKPEKSDITFIKNTSVLHNEFVGHRISLCPLYFTKDEIASYDPSKYKFVLKKKNKGLKQIDVTTDDIVFSASESSKSIRDVFPHDSITDDPIILARLKPNVLSPEDGEEIEVEFRARKGIAKQHARWSSVSTCTYENSLDEDIVKEKRKLIRDPTALNAFETLEKYRLYKKNQYDEPCAFKFTIVSECAITAPEILFIAFDVLLAKVKGLSNTPNKFEALPISDDNIYSITIRDEDHTLGNLLQTHIYNKHVRGKSDLNITYVGYYQPHPLESDIVLKIKTSASNFDVNKFMKLCSADLAEEIQDLVGAAKKGKLSA